MDKAVLSCQTTFIDLRSGYLSESFITTLLTFLTIFPTRKIYFKRKVMFFYWYSIVFTLSILNCKNRDDDASNITAYHSTGN
jgi:hypothetical protein